MQEEVYDRDAKQEPVIREEKKKHGRKKWILLSLLVVLLVMTGAVLIFLLTYYHADETALAALKSDAMVRVTETDYGWFFDGPSETDALVFYPGARVEETAYAPMLHRLAEQGMDVCLVKMPFRLAILGSGRAEDVMKEYNYRSWYIGGHSMGGAFAARYASKHAEDFRGVILFAAYTTDSIGKELPVLMIYGSEDRVVRKEKLEEGRKLAENCAELVIEGGNHAQFGNYGIQSGDGEATISADEQQRQTVDFIAAVLLH